MKKTILLSFVFIIAVLMTGITNAYGADDIKKVSYISVEYKGYSLLIGSEYNNDDIVVTAFYEGGSNEVVTNYGTGNKRVTKEGENNFTIVYNGKVATFTIIGKSIQEISAMYNGGEHSVGNKINESEVVVNITYSDGTFETLEEGYTLSQTTISRVGENVITVIYNGKRATFTVMGTAAKTVDSIYVSYIGVTSVVGREINQKDIMLTALYTDGTSEIIYNYTLSPAIVRNIGENTITASYKGKSTKFVVKGIEKVITGITAKYTGGSVAVGKSVKLSDIVVTATYNDGSEGKETEFDIIGGGKILTIGTNTLTINAQGSRAEIKVVGVEPTAADFASAPSYEVTNGRRTGKVAVDIPSGFLKEDIVITSLESLLVKNILTREIRNGDYIPFTIEFKNLDLDAETPMLVQVTIPSDYDINGCAVYFTPNRKTVIGKMNADAVGNTSIQFMAFHEGTYVLTYDPDWRQIGQWC